MTEEFLVQVGLVSFAGIPSFSSLSEIFKSQGSKTPAEIDDKGLPAQ